MSDPLVLKQLFCVACLSQGRSSLWRFVASGFLGRMTAANFDCPGCGATTTSAVRAGAFEYPKQGLCPSCAAVTGAARCEGCGAQADLHRFEAEGFLGFDREELGPLLREDSGCLARRFELGRSEGRDAAELLRISEARIRLEPAAPEPWRARAGLLAELGFHALAIMHFKKAIVLGGGTPEDILGLAAAVDGLDEPEAALAIVKHALEADPRHAGARAQAALLLATLGRDEEAYRLNRESLELDPANTSAWELMATLHMKLKELEQALDCWERVLASAPDNPGAWLHKGYCLLGLERAAEAVETAERLLERAPLEPKGIELKFEALFAAVDHQGVFDYAAKLLERVPDDCDVLYHKARACLALGRLDEGLAAAEAILEKDPRNRNGLRALEAFREGLAKRT